MTGKGREGARADRRARRGSVRALETADAPSLDPDVVGRAYREHRARRQARIERNRRSRRAGARFWVVLVALVGTCGLLAVTTWREIGRLFGL